MTTVVLAIALAAVLAWAGVAKIRDPRVAARAAGVPGAAVRVLAVAELVVAAALVSPPTRAAGGVATVVLGAAFAVRLGVLRARGVRRVACGCFGSAAERPVPLLAARAVALGLAGAAVAADVPARVDASTQTLLVAAVALLAVAVAVLAVLVLALYRQVGVLHRRLGPRVPLEVAEEGPPLGASAPPLHELTRHGSELVVFGSPGCRLCAELAPGVRALARGGLAVIEVSEPERPDVFDRYRVPGTPFVVHVVDGRVVAKGLVNTLEQLEILLQTGHDRVAAGA